MQAGYRGQAPYITYLFFRMVTPAACALLAAVYLFVVLDLHQPAMIKLGMCIAAAYIGMHAPLMFLKNRIARRQLSIKRAFPDALDLLLICVGIRHGHRGRVPKSVGGDRQPVDTARGRAEPDDGGTVVPAGSPQGV